MKNRILCKRVIAGAIVLVTWGLVAGLRADAGSSPDGGSAAAPTKILHFPQDQCMGRLSVEDPNLGSSYLESGRDLSLPLGLDPKRVCLSSGWDFTGLARSDAVVPSGRNIQLIVMLRLRKKDSAKIAALPAAQYKMFGADRCYVDPDDLSGLSQLGPRDLYMLKVSSLVRTADADRRVLEPISHLTGLQILCLYKTGVTGKGMEYLKPLRSLKALELAEEKIGVNGLAVLKDLPELEYLDLYTWVTDAGLKQVAQLPSLRWLRIAGGKMWGTGLAELANLPRLERLCLCSGRGGNPISDRHIKFLEGLTQLKSLTLWGSACNTLTDTSLASISKLKNLEELYFIRTSPRFTSAGVAHLKELKNLRKVDFAQIWSGPAGAYYGDEVVRQLATLPNLESIRGIGYLTDEGMKTLATFRNLKCLGIALKDDKQDYYGPTGLSHLAGLGSLEELLFTGGRSLSDNDLADLESLGHLKKLHVSSRHLTDRSLASISKLDQLELLDFSVFGGSGVSKSGLKQLSGLTNLHTLDVKLHPVVEDSGDGVILDFSALTKLNTLTLDGCSLRDADLASLAGLHHLEWLVLAGDFTEEGLWHLRNLPTVKHLLIRGITCIDGDRLSDVGGLAKFVEMTLSGRITDDALRRLTGFPSLWSLTVETHELIWPATVARLKQILPMITYIHIDKPQRIMQPDPRQVRQQRERTVSPSRVNQRTQQNRRRRR
ncbi:MAG: leucine-rich repeat domain-containing protein [Planctomycetota bacterium]